MAEPLSTGEAALLHDGVRPLLNAGSMGVMRRLGMRIVKNPSAEPRWLQVVGVLDTMTRTVTDATRSGPS
jgi:hypothetical protein